MTERAGCSFLSTLDDLALVNELAAIVGNIRHFERVRVSRVRFPTAEDKQAAIWRHELEYELCLDELRRRVAQKNGIN